MSLLLNCPLPLPSAGTAHRRRLERFWSNSSHVPSSPRGERYIGMWRADQRHGPGVVVTQAGVCYQGTFQVDKMVVSGVTCLCPERPVASVTHIHGPLTGLLARATCPPPLCRILKGTLPVDVIVLA